MNRNLWKFKCMGADEYSHYVSTGDKVEFLGVKKRLVNNDLKQTNSFDTAYDEEYISKVKRRSRIDLGNQHVKKSAKEGRDAGLLQQAASSTSQQDDNSLPTRFGKKYVPRDTRRPKYLRDEGSSDRAERQPGIDPFDICLPNSSKSSVQKTMSLENNMEQDSEIESPIIETRQLLRPGMILLTNYISLGEQVLLLATLKLKFDSCLNSWKSFSKVSFTSYSKAF